MATLDSTVNKCQNMERLCRTCALPADPLLPLFLPTDTPSPAVMLSACTRVAIDPEDSLPKAVCQKCLGRISDAYAFNAEALKAQRTLAEMSAPKRRAPKRQSKKERPRVFERPREIRILPKTFSPLDLAVDAERAPAKIIVAKNFQEAIAATANARSCKLCGRTFISAECLRAHVRRSHSDAPTTKTCSVCNVEFADSAGLTAHNLEVHFPTRPDGRYGCDICKKVYKQKYILNRHKKKAHPVEKNTGTCCPKCTTNFATRDELLSHQNSGCAYDQIQISSDTDRISCKLCKRLFASAKNLSLHLKSHFANVCDYCNRGFFKEELLLNHISEHSLTGNPYACVLCDNCFQDKKALQKHQHEIHRISDEIFFCGHCNLLHFLEVGELQNHLRSEHCDKMESTSMHMDSEIIIETPSLQSALVPISSNNIEDNTILDKGTDDKKFIITYYIEEAAINEFDGAIEKLSETVNNSSIIPGESNLSLEDIKVLNNKINCDIEKKKAVTPADTFTLLKPSLNDSLLQNKESVNYILMDITSGDNETTNSEISNSVLKKNILDKEIDSSIVDVFEAQYPTANQSEFSIEVNDIRKFSKIKTNQKYTMSIVKPKIIDKITKQSPECDLAMQCKVCDKKFARMFNLQKHMILHKDQPLVCIGCKYTANNLNNLNDHIKKCQLIRKSGNMICTACGKRLTTAAGYRYHLQSHSPTRRYTCLLCQKHFLTSSNLRVHLRTIHSKERPFACKSCPRVFASRDHLNKHITSTHLIRRDHVCHSCGRKFIQRSHLTQHMWIHTGIKPHCCPHCSNKYTSKCSLTKHLRKYHRQNNQKDHTVGRSQKIDKNFSIIDTTSLKLSDIHLNDEIKIINEIVDSDNFEVVVVVGEGDSI